MAGRPPCLAPPGVSASPPPPVLSALPRGLFGRVRDVRAGLGGPWKLGSPKRGAMSSMGGKERGGRAAQNGPPSVAAASAPPAPSPAPATPTPTPAAASFFAGRAPPAIHAAGTERMPRRTGRCSLSRSYCKALVSRPINGSGKEGPALMQGGGAVARSRCASTCSRWVRDQGVQPAAAAAERRLSSARVVSVSGARVAWWAGVQPAEARAEASRPVSAERRS